MRLLVVALLFTLTACTSLRPSETPAPVESAEAPSSTPVPTPERPVVGPPLPTEQERAEAARGSAPPAPAPAPTAPERPAATAALLTQVEQAIAAGELDRAAALVERALRITPRDAPTWYTLANIQYQQGRHADAEGSAQRALSFAGGNDPLQRRINALLGTIRSAR